jgi:hypothetical protein
MVVLLFRIANFVYTTHKKKPYLAFLILDDEYSETEDLFGVFDGHRYIKIVFYYELKCLLYLQQSVCPNIIIFTQKTPLRSFLEKDLFFCLFSQ